MAKITYVNKETINPQPSVADKNKVTSDDMNEIKSVVNKNDDNIGALSNLNTTDKSSIVNAINELKDREVYSSNEIKTNKIWIDNKPIYRKVLTLNVAQSSVQAEQDITSLNIATVTHLEGISQSDPTSTNYTWLTTEDRMRTYYNPISKKIIAQVGSRYPTTPCTIYVIIEYTKTS